MGYQTLSQLSPSPSPTTVHLTHYTDDKCASKKDERDITLGVCDKKTKTIHTLVGTVGVKKETYSEKVEIDGVLVPKKLINRETKRGRRDLP